MPNKPKTRNRPWVQPRQQHERSVDMSWFYNDWRWRKFSKAFKKRNPLCVECLKDNKYTESTVTDHIVPLREGSGADLNNLKDKDFQALCDEHHNSKSGKEGKNYK